LSYKEEFDELIIKLKRKNHIDINLIKKAFLFAEKLHTGQKRKSGEEYIVHPVEVAKILADLNFDENVIAAGLLHDVIEDCACTFEDLKQKFNIKVANLVDSVTAIKYEKKERNPEFFKFLMQEKSYNKLYSIGMSDKLSFYVKFADRLHNLRTIDIFPKYKQIEKVKETEKFLIPILTNIKANTLYYNTKNECYKIIEPVNYKHFNSRYQAFLTKNKNYFEKVIAEFQLNLNNMLIKKTIGSARLVVKTIKPYEIISNQLPELAIEASKVKEFMFNSFVTKKIFIVLKNSNKKINKEELLFKLFSSSSWFSSFKIIGFLKEEKMQENPMIVEDDIGNKLAIFVHTEKEHFQYNNGLVEGIEIPYDEELKQFEISENYIKVKTNKGEEILMPEHSTVLDFAFKIHNDFGFSCTGAYLNNSPTKMPIYTTLNNGDQINLVVERDELTNACVYVAKIRWLSYVTTEYAKKKLSKYFESMYEG
jgi:GTP diphosphokinase / guanosine-3',5'-bis(diphosphate) 3'-diphosphatase